MTDNEQKTVRYVNLSAQFEEERAELMPRIEETLASGMLVGGAEVETLESEIAEYCGVRHVVAVNSGTDALLLGLIAAGIGEGGEVITPPNSFVASTSTIVKAGATPVFADVGPDELFDPIAVEAAITPRTVAIMPVHLRGNVCNMEALGTIAQRHGLLLIEDAAQSMGSCFAGRRTGSLGDIGCFSAHPLKNFNAAGDAGFVTTDREDIVDKIRLLQNQGLEGRGKIIEWGMVSRLDALQATILRFRLNRMDDVIERRRANADNYRRLLEGASIALPRVDKRVFHTYHNFVVQSDSRDELQDHLQRCGVEAFVHYETPIHLQPAAKELGYKEGALPVTERLAKTILSLPINQFLSLEQQEHVASSIKGFFRLGA